MRKIRHRYVCKPPGQGRTPWAHLTLCGPLARAASLPAKPSASRQRTYNCQHDTPCKHPSAHPPTRPMCTQAAGSRWSAWHVACQPVISLLSQCWVPRWTLANAVAVSAQRSSSASVLKRLDRSVIQRLGKSRSMPALSSYPVRQLPSKPGARALWGSPCSQPIPTAS